MALKTKYKHIHFEKTDLDLGILWECYSNSKEELLAVIPEQKTWGQYVTAPQQDCEFSSSCHRDIADFLDQINK